MVLPSRSVGEGEVKETALSNGVSPADEDSLGPVDSSNLSYLESQYLQFLEDPNSVSSDWRAYFHHIADAQAENGDVDRFRALQMGNGSVVSPGLL